MAKYNTFIYGTGILYGMAMSITGVSPFRGPSTGGNNFIIEGSGFDPLQWNDDFTAGVLNLSRWTDISGGSGSLTTGSSHLTLDTGAVGGSIAGVESKAVWTNVQSEIRVTIPHITVYPVSTVYLINYVLYVDANNYASMRLELDTQGTMTLVCDLYSLGSLVTSYSTPWTRGLSTFKILRYNDKVYFIANGSVIYTEVGMSTSLATYRIYADNVAAAYAVSGIIVESFVFRPYAVFADNPVHDSVTVSVNRMRGTVVPSTDTKGQSAAYAGLVDVSVVAGGTYTALNAYEYYYLDSLRVINSEQSDIKMSFINDAQIKSKTGVKKGVGV